MKRIAMFIVSLLAGAVLLSAQDAAAIMDAAKNRIKKDTLSTRSRMEISAKNGSTTERRIDQYSKNDANGNERMVVVFQSPANVAGTRFLTIDKTAGGSDRWIYLPSLAKVRRIAASESGGSFMGTDFSYDDMSAMNRSVDLDTYTILREEVLNGSSCYVIQSVPKDNAYQYSKTITWVDKDKSLIYKSEMYDRRGGLVKVMEISDFKDVQGRLTAMCTKVSTQGAGSSTTIYIEIVKYDSEIPEGVFTTSYLETGRVR
ncbi:MAG: outer membrane lipoprotein-sorting protein [Spirochaetaceae bacterium]|jgi:outer membrane lipoprotein-sorting protein|nr:outer membrane lipoprotein-sorting protein [Spirochaetaceae bacterium]